MQDFKSLKIKNKLRILSILSILSILVLGFVSNYFFRTSKVLGIIINAERVHNNTFKEGIEDFYKFQISGNIQWLDSSVAKIESANQMSHNFAVINQLLQLPEQEYIEILFKNYGEAYNHDRSNAYLMVNRIQLLLWTKNAMLAESQKVAFNGYQLGEKIKSEILSHKNDSTYATGKNLEVDLQKMKVFNHDFAVAISSINNFANRLLFLGISLMVFLLVLGVALISTLTIKSIADPVH